MKNNIIELTGLKRIFKITFLSFFRFSVSSVEETYFFRAEKTMVFSASEETCEPCACGRFDHEDLLYFFSKIDCQ